MLTRSWTDFEGSDEDTKDGDVGEEDGESQRRWTRDTQREGGWRRA